MKRRQAAFTGDFWRDLLDASDWYDEKQSGLGWLFREEVLSVARLVTEQAEAYRRVHHDYRRAIVARYQHLIVFLIDGDRILFVGLVHGMRKLPRWLARRIDNE